MSQNVFTNPYVSALPVLVGTGNGTLTVDRLTHFTITQTYTAICTAVAPFTVFTILGSLDGPVGVATVGSQFIDEDLKVFLTINQGPIQFAIGDQFTFGVNQGTDLNQQNIDTYDELPQKNFSQGVVGQNAGDDNLRFKNVALTAKATIQDLEFTSLLADQPGNGIRLEYYSTTVPIKAFLQLQDILYQADTAGLAGNGISIEYEDYTPATNAYTTIQDLLWVAVTPGAAGNSIQVEYTTGGVAGAEVVTVIGNLIQIQIQSGVSTAAQIKSAVQAHGVAGTMISGLKTGTGLETQTAPVAPQSLTGGADAIGAAGSEVVTVVGQAIKVKLQSGVSTATQVKAAVDAFGPAAALVDLTINGVGSNPQAAPFAATNLSGGQDSIGAPGSEIVTVDGTRIRVGFQSGVNTASDIKAKLDATPAVAALVSIAITGTGSNPQSAPASRYLSHGHKADTWWFNTNEITNPSQFFDGNGNLALNELVLHGGIWARGASYFRGVVSLDDILYADNNSGLPIPNLQRTINKLIQNSKVFLGTEDNSKVRWNAPNLYFTSPLIIAFEDVNVVNRVLHTLYSPLALADGESMYVTLNRTANTNLVPVVAATVPAGEDIYRIVSRRGSYLIFGDGTILGENQVSRIGAAIDLSAQIFTLVDMTGQFIHDPSIAGKMSWNSQIKLKPLGSSAIVTIFADEITLADDEVAYILLDDPIVTANKVVQKAARSNVLMNRPDVFWLFYRSGSKLYLRFGGEMEQGEERNIGDTISDDIYLYMGSAGETDNDPDYTNADGAPTTNSVVSDGDNLTKAIKKLDTQAGALTTVTRQDRNAKMIEGGVWAFEATGVNKLEWSAAAYIQVPGLALSRNTIPAGNVILAAGEVAYVTINRTAGVAANLTVQVSAIASLVPTDDTIIIARRVTAGVIVGTSSFLLQSGESLDLDGALAEINRYFASLKMKPHATNPNRVVVSAADVSLLDGSYIGQLFQSKRLDFTGMVIDFSTGVIYKPDELTILGTNFVPGTWNLSEYGVYAVGLAFGADLVNGKVAVTGKVDVGTFSGPTVDNAQHPTHTSDRPIGWVWVQEQGGGVAPITNSNFIRLAVGAGSGGGSGGSGIEVFDEGGSVSTGITRLDFVGVGVTATLASPGRVTVAITGAGGGGISELTSDCEGDVKLELVPCSETWVLEDANNIRWLVTVADDGTLSTTTPTVEPITPLFRVTTPTGFATIRVTTAGALYTDDVNLAGSIDDDFHLRSANDIMWRVTVNALGQIVMVTPDKDSQFRITDELDNNYEVTRLTDDGVLKYFRLFPSLASLPAPPTSFGGMVATAWLQTAGGPRQVYYDPVPLQWRYVHDNSTVV